MSGLPRPLTSAAGQSWRGQQVADIERRDQAGLGNPLEGIGATWIYSRRFHDCCQRPHGPLDHSRFTAAFIRGPRGAEPSSLLRRGDMREPSVFLAPWVADLMLRRSAVFLVIGPPLGQSIPRRHFQRNGRKSKASRRGSGFRSRSARTASRRDVSTPHIPDLLDRQEIETAGMAIRWHFHSSSGS